MSAIDDKYSWLLGTVVNLGGPRGPESTCADGIGRVRRYEYGTIYSFPPVGAFEVHGAIADRYAELNAEAGELGYPTSDESALPDGSGRYNDFEFGRITWTEATNTVDAVTVMPAAVMRVQSFIDCVAAVEAAYPQDTPEMVVTRIRQQYYPDPTDVPALAVKFDQLLPDAPKFVASVRRTLHPAVLAAAAYDTLAARADENGIADNPSPYMLDGRRNSIDIGHALLCLDALVHPRAGVPYSNYGIPAIDPASWVADLALAGFWTATHARDGRPAKAPRTLPTADFDGYFAMSAPSSDLYGDADGFGLFGMWLNGGGQQFSTILRRYYLLEANTLLGWRWRWRTFCGVNALTFLVDGGVIDWDDGIGDQWINRISRLCDLLDDDYNSLLMLWIDPNASGTRRAWPYSGTAFSAFRDWLRLQLLTELAA